MIEFVRLDSGGWELRHCEQAEGAMNEFVRLMEELGELTQAVCKSERFGPFKFHPDTPETNNIETVLHEWEDVKAAMMKYLFKICPNDDMLLEFNKGKIP